MGPGEAGIQERSMKMLKKLVKENKDRAVEKMEPADFAVR